MTALKDLDVRQGYQATKTQDAPSLCKLGERINHVDFHLAQPLSGCLPNVLIGLEQRNLIIETDKVSNNEKYIQPKGTSMRKKTVRFGFKNVSHFNHDST
jgi:hypothetical protein